MNSSINTGFTENEITDFIAGQTNEELSERIVDSLFDKWVGKELPDELQNAVKRYITEQRKKLDKIELSPEDEAIQNEIVDEFYQKLFSK